jgi:hypothetical protein
VTANDWNGLVEEFRALGGVAENVRLDRGALGRGLFPIDRSKPVKIVVPENLLFPVDELEFVNGRLRVKKNGAAPSNADTFFEEYQEAFSWGAGGRSDCEAFLASMAELPEPVREVLTNDWGLGNMFRGVDAETVQKRFLRTRMIYRKGRAVLMPVLELVNHDATGVPFAFTNGIGIAGTYAREVFARYNYLDPFGVFLTWGFPNAEPVCYSLSMRFPLPLAKRALVIRREVQKSKLRGRVRVPEVTVEGNKILLSSVMLGNKKFPKLARGLFQHSMKDLGLGEHVDEIFVRLRQMNGQRFLNLLSVLDGHEGRTITALRQMCRYQLASLMFCIGTRGL